MCNHYLWNTAKNSLCWEIPREKTDGILKAQQFLGQATVKGALSQYFFVQSVRHIQKTLHKVCQHVACVNYFANLRNTEYSTF